MSSVTIPCPACGRELKLKDRSLLGKVGKCPKCERRFTLEEPAEEVELELVEDSASDVPVGRQPQWVDQNAAATAASTAVLPDLATIETGSSPASEMRRRRRRSKSGVIVGLVVCIAAGGLGWLMWPYLTAPQPATSTANPSRPAPAATSGSVSGSEDRPLDEYAQVYASPTPGTRPITLKWMPAGAKFIFHLRPHELWQPGGLAEEFRYSLGPLGVWLEEQITTVCMRPPSAIEEATICLIPWARGTEPELAAVVTLVEDAKRSELLLEFGGERIDDYGEPVYLTGDRAFVIEDTRTFAVGPASMAAEMAQAADGFSPTSIEIEELLPLTDRDRHFTVVFETIEARLNAETIIDESVRPLYLSMLDWFGDDVSAAAWSVHLDREKFYSEILIPTGSQVRPETVRQRLAENVDVLPEQILKTVKFMQPSEVGKRRVIGRFPAMLQAASMATEVENRAGYIRMVTPLPERAGPNLAVGTLLTWDESTRTDFSAEEPPIPVAAAKQVPEKVADRLQLKVDTDYRRTPLQEAFDYLSEEISTPIEIDGEALKLSGYTKNMPVTFAKTNEPALASIREIFGQFDKLALVVDESQKRITVTTIPVAEQQGLTIFPVR